MLVALGKRVIIKPLRKEEAQTASGLFIPITGNVESDIGEVVGVGKGDKLKMGEFVVMPHYGLNKIYIDDVLYYFAFESDIPARFVKLENGYCPVSGSSIETPLPKSYISLGNNEALEVLGDRVLLECIGDSDKFENTEIVKADNWKKYARKGWLRALGIGLTENVLNDLGIAKDDKQVYDCYSGIDIDINGLTHKFVHVDNLMCKEV
jgi:co-chaperonin GroES (HSP10)